MKVIYICGPMRGYPDHNFPAFNRAAARFRALGWAVLNPVEIGQAAFGNSTDIPPEAYMREDVRRMAEEATDIAVLPEWERSTGARCEVGVAITLGLPFHDAETGERIARPVRCVIAGGYERAPGCVDTLDTLRDEINAWQRATFTHRTPHSIATHLLREAGELHRTPHDDEELANVQMLVFGLADGRDLVGALRAKLDKNKRRVWGTPDADGVVEHLAEGAA